MLQPPSPRQRESQIQMPQQLQLRARRRRLNPRLRARLVERQPFLESGAQVGRPRIDHRTGISLMRLAPSGPA